MSMCLFLFLYALTRANHTLQGHYYQLATSNLYHHLLLIRYLGNPVNHFPIYEPSEERIAEIAKAHAEENNPLGVHYDASQEIRAKGAGFYQFSGDEDTRRAQMEELKAVREETERTRQETGAVDVRPGEVEGMRDGEASGTSGTAKSRAMEKRKRDIEERRKMIEAKRRKIKAPEDDGPTGARPSEVTTSPHPPLIDRGDDPFSALETNSATALLNNKDKGRAMALPVIDAADNFLAQLEKDFIGNKSKKKKKS